MIFTEHSIMSLGADCYPLAVMKYIESTTNISVRIPGPVDNMSGGAPDNIKLLLKGEIEKEILIDKDYRMIEKQDKSDYDFYFNHYGIIHNDFREQTYQNNLKERFQNLYKFYKESKGIFLYHIRECENTSIDNIDNFIGNFKDLNILDRTVFICCYSNDNRFKWLCNYKPYFKDYLPHLIIIEITDWTLNVVDAFNQLKSIKV